MVRQFRSKGLRRLHADGDTRGLGGLNAKRASKMLFLLTSASRPEELDYPGFRFHALKGNLAGYYSITVNRNWRIIFRWGDGEACDIDLVDYH